MNECSIKMYLNFNKLNKQIEVLTKIIVLLIHQTNKFKTLSVKSLKNMFTAESGNKKKEDEMTGRAVKVIDLLQHAAELGNTDALYTLAQISLVRPSPTYV